MAADGAADRLALRLEGTELQLVRWAAEQAGLTIEEFARRRLLSAARRTAPPAAAPAPASADEAPYPEIIGRSAPMLALHRLLDRIVPTESTVLIQAESGTGKELVARAIHASGPRRERPFLAHNCSAFTDSLLESTLFGHVKGSFTGAVRDQRGLFEAADGGTFFLDEIGDMSPAMQVKLLRLLQTGTFLPVGAERPRSCDVRIIAATHRDLRDMVQRGTFREDLYYRVNVLRVEIPPLRDRTDDLTLLVERFLRDHVPEGKLPAVAAETMDALQRYPWPGNVRELENEIERAVVMARGEATLAPEHLSPRIRDAADASRRAATRPRAPAGRGLRAALDDLEREILAEGLRRVRGNRSLLARQLGISRSNLIKKVEKYGLER